VEDYTNKYNVRAVMRVRGPGAAVKPHRDLTRVTKTHPNMPVFVVLRGRISPIYLADAAAEPGLVAGSLAPDMP
jgi:hypothetical protein